MCHAALKTGPLLPGPITGEARWPVLGTTIHPYYLSRAERPTLPIHLRRSDIQPQLDHGHSSISGPPRQRLPSEPLHLVGRDIRYRPRPGNTSRSRCLYRRVPSRPRPSISRPNARAPVLLSLSTVPGRSRFCDGELARRVSGYRNLIPPAPSRQHPDDVRRKTLTTHRIQTLVGSTPAASVRHPSIGAGPSAIWRPETTPLILS